MPCEVAELPFHALANYGTWSIDFDDEGINYKGTIMHKQLLFTYHILFKSTYTLLKPFLLPLMYILHQNFLKKTKIRF